MWMNASRTNLSKPWGKSSAPWQNNEHPSVISNKLYCLLTDQVATISYGKKNFLPTASWNWIGACLGCSGLRCGRFCGLTLPTPVLGNGATIFKSCACGYGPAMCRRARLDGHSPDDLNRRKFAGTDAAENWIKCSGGRWATGQPCTILAGVRPTSE
jgi:hypothetical protein